MKEGVGKIEKEEEGNLKEGVGKIKGGRGKFIKREWGK